MKRPTRTGNPPRGGWSGGPVPSGSNWFLAIACLVLGFGAVAVMVWISQ